MAEEPTAGPSSSHPPAPSPGEGLETPLVHRSIPGVEMHPFMYTRMFPSQDPEENDHGPGIYAIPCHPYMSPMAGFSPNTLIPLRYKILTRSDSTGGANEEHGQEVRQQQVPRRQVVVRRFHFAFQIDLALILKLAAVVFLLSQDGSKHKLILLMLCASLIYLYRAGVLAPMIRWLQQAGAPPQRRRHVQPQNGPPVGHGDGNNPQPDPNAGVERQNQNQPTIDQEQLAANENEPEPERGHGINWWLIVKEIQVFFIGFFTTLIPGFHNNEVAQ